MVALRYAYLLALVFWLGGLLTLGGLGAPAMFTALTGAHGTAGREMAGLAFGAVLRRFQLASYACSAVMVVSLVSMAALGPRPVRLAIRVGIIAAMTLLTLYSGLVVGRRVEALRAQIGGAVAALPESDARRVEFGRLHGLSTMLLGLTAAGGLALLYWEARTYE
ncbi:MAG TPA: DUF4149 domain-containing protein [Vicinamibacterales bacterium]|nr:DUF4149 domain-containing protein [Vicinamibacterales bacterium]